MIGVPPATPSTTAQHKNVDDTLQQIKTPFHNQILERRIETLDADREVLRRLNKSLVEENELLKSSKTSHIPGLSKAYKRSRRRSLTIRYEIL